MNIATLEYKRKVWKFLEEIKPGNIYTIEKLARPENRAEFIEAVKHYMESLPFQGFVTFNQNYTKLYRTDPVPFKER